MYKYNDGYWLLQRVSWVLLAVPVTTLQVHEIGRQLASPLVLCDETTLEAPHQASCMFLHLGTVTYRKQHEIELGAGNKAKPQGRREVGA